MTLLNMSIYGAVIILAVLIIRAFTLHKLPKKTFLVLWSVALLRLLVPFEIHSGLSVYSLMPETWTVEHLLSNTDTTDTKQPDDSGNTNTAGTSTQGNVQNPAANSGTSENGNANTTINNSPVQNSGTQQTNTAGNAEPNTSTSDTPGNSSMPNDSTIENILQNPGNTTNNNASTANTKSTAAIPNTHLTPKPQPTFTELLRTHWLLLLWSMGALCCAVFFLISYIACRLEFRTALPVTNEHAREFLRYHWTNRTIHLRQSDRISAPLTYGLFHPVILLPKKMDWENYAQLDYVLYHEFTHIRRFDLLPKLLVTAALCLHWFNPFVWAMYYLFNRDIELSCDECVVDYFETTGSKADYARALINMEEKKSRLTPLCNNFSKQAIEERITAIMKSKPVTNGMIAAAILIVATVVVTLATSAKDVSASPDSSSPFMVFQESDFATGAFDAEDEATLAKTLWESFLEFCQLYNSSINASKNAPGYTTEDFVPLTMDARWPEGYIATSYYLPVADQSLTSLEDFWAYLGTVCSENYIKTLEYAVFYTAEDSLLSREPLLAEQNGTLYTKPFDNEAPLPDFTNPVTWLDNRSDPYFYLLNDNRVVLLYKNPIADNTIEVFFTQQKGGWYVDDLSFDNFPSHFIPDSINNALHRFRYPLNELINSSLIDTGEPKNPLEAWQDENIPTWQKLARNAIGTLYGPAGDAYKTSDREEAASLKELGLENLSIDLSAYSADREWWENGAFYDEEKDCYYVIYVLSAQTTVTEGPGILLVTVPVNQPEQYTILPLGNAGELGLWFGSPVKIGTNIYFEGKHFSSSLWCIDTVTLRLYSLSYINEALEAEAAPYLRRKGLGEAHQSSYYVCGQMGDYIVCAAQISYAFDLGIPYFTIYHVYHNNRVAGELPLEAEYIEEHLIPVHGTTVAEKDEVLRLTLDELVQAATSSFAEYYEAQHADSGSYEIISVHLSEPNTLRVDIRVSEVRDFEVYTEGTAYLAYSFANQHWEVKNYHETTPDYLSSMAGYPTMPSSDVVVLEKNWNLTVLDEIELPRFQTLAKAGGSIATEASDSINIGQFYTITLNGIRYFFLNEDAPEKNAWAWNIAITTPDHPLSGGARVGMTQAELLALHPALAKTELTQYDPVFAAKYSSHFAFRDDQFPESFLEEYDYAYTAYLDKGRDGLPVCIAFLIKDNTVAAITVYMPTAN